MGLHRRRPSQRSWRRTPTPISTRTNLFCSLHMRPLPLSNIHTAHKARRGRLPLNLHASPLPVVGHRRRNEPGVVEKCWSELFEIWRAVGFDSHCDLHTAGTLSHPFIFVDRVLHRGEETKPEAEELWQKLQSMCRALGITLIAEQPPKQYISAALHRSTSGAVLNGLRVPSVTIECGAA